MQQWLNLAEDKGTSTWLLNCDHNEDGPWAGLKDLLTDILPQVQAQAALADYNAALALDVNQPLTLANRAILHYEAGRYQEALNDLNQAIALDPENSDLYQNRAVALTALQRFQEVVGDLKTYLTLAPFAEDRLEVESQLLVLQTSK